MTDQDVQINIIEIRKPELDAIIVGDSVAKQIESRINYRRAIKMAIQSTMRAGAEGVKIRISGRLNGAEMARSEEYKEGRIPLHTFRADIDYAIREALTVYGKIGIKVWICKGEVFTKRDLSPLVGLAKKRTSHLEVVKDKIARKEVVKDLIVAEEVETKVDVGKKKIKYIKLL